MPATIEDTEEVGIKVRFTFIPHTEWNTLFKGELSKELGWHYCVTKQPLEFNHDGECLGPITNAFLFHCFPGRKDGKTSHISVGMNAEMALWSHFHKNDLRSIIFLDLSPADVVMVQAAIETRNFEALCRVIDTLVEQ